MKALSEKHRNWMTAITFAEAGEWDTARDMMPASGPKNEISLLQKIFMAVAFAEAGLHDVALHLIDNQQHDHHYAEDFLEAVGLRGVRVTYAVITLEAV